MAIRPNEQTAQGLDAKLTTWPEQGRGAGDDLDSSAVNR